MERKKTMSEQALASRQLVRDWITGIERRFNVSRAEIASRSNMKPSTIYRWFDDDFSHMPSYPKLRQIADAFGIEMPGTVAPVAGFSEADATRYDSAPLETSEALAPNQSDWRLGTRALELAGFVPGDVVRLDISIASRPGDAVFAQVYNLERGMAQTRLRLFDPPYLVTRTMDPDVNAKPLYVDGEHVVILGPIIRSTRIRPA